MVKYEELWLSNSYKFSSILFLLEVVQLSLSDKHPPILIQIVKSVTDDLNSMIYSFKVFIVYTLYPAWAFTFLYNHPFMRFSLKASSYLIEAGN